MGYAGMKFLSETMTWTRAPADLKKCGEEVAKPGPEAPATPEEALPRREAEPHFDNPAAKPVPADKATKRASASRRSRDCKVGYAGMSIKVPCNILE
jgi:hypothetical protein